MEGRSVWHTRPEFVDIYSIEDDGKSSIRDADEPQLIGDNIRDGDDLSCAAECSLFEKCVGPGISSLIERVDTPAHIFQRSIGAAKPCAMYKVGRDDIHGCEGDEPACLDYIDVSLIAPDPRCAPKCEGYVLQEPSGECTGPNTYKAYTLVGDQIISATFRYYGDVHAVIERSVSDLVIHPTLSIAKAKDMRD